MERRACPCCGFLTLRSLKGDFEICEVCFWEDDPVQLDDPTFEGGANVPSLEQARANFQKFGAMEERFVTNVRPPRDDEVPG